MPPAKPDAPEIVVAIEALSDRGDGIARHDGARLIVPFGLPGERLKVRPVDRNSVIIVERLESAPDRREPPCPVFGSCGGCQLQHLGESAYRAFKLDRLRRALVRAGFDEPPIGPMLTTPAAGRRIARLKARRVGETVVLGFMARRSHRIVDAADCRVLAPAIMAALPAVRSVLGEVLDRKAAAGVHILAAANGLDIWIETAAALSRMRAQRLAAWAGAHDIARIAWGREREIAAMHRAPVLCVGALRVTPPVGAFVQASAAGEAHLVTTVLAALPPDARRIADLHAGLGTFAGPLLARARVHAVDAAGDSLAALRGAAGAAGRGERLAIEVRDLVRRPLDPAELDGFDAVVFDPPRAGAEGQAAMLARAPVPTAVAVSCEPSTLARDLALLRDGGYRLEQVTPVDQFVWSHHLECVAVLRRDSRQPARNGRGAGGRARRAGARPSRTPPSARPDRSRRRSGT